jgi:hypothetical protein
MTASGYGSFVMGSSDTGDIAASDHGAFAMGRAIGGYTILSSGQGSLAFGRTSTGDITASANNAVQFGPGVNAQVDSLKVGIAGIAFKGTDGAPSAPVDGNVWMDGTTVMIRQEGVNGAIAIGAAGDRQLHIPASAGVWIHDVSALTGEFDGLGRATTILNSGTLLIPIPLLVGDRIKSVKFGGVFAVGTKNVRLRQLSLANNAQNKENLAFTDTGAHEDTLVISPQAVVAADETYFWAFVGSSTNTGDIFDGIVVTYDHP